MNTYQIATIPGDGIGKEVIPESVKILNAIAAKCGFQLKFKNHDYSCEYFKKYGKMMPEDGLERLRDSDSIFFRSSWLSGCTRSYIFVGFINSN